MRKNVFDSYDAKCEMVKGEWGYSQENRTSDTRFGPT